MRCGDGDSLVLFSKFLLVHILFVWFREIAKEKLMISFSYTFTFPLRRASLHKPMTQTEHQRVRLRLNYIVS